MCFVEGTMVLTAEGLVAIECIAVGDMVIATDLETGETAEKEVKNTFVNETEELAHVFVDNEEIVCTPGHKFYAPERGWTSAIKLRAGDKLQLVNGEYVTVEKVQHELLEEPVKIYNFEVEDFHTYYVGTDVQVLVHNRKNCGSDSVTGDSEKRIANPNGRKGGKAHQTKIQEIIEDAKDRGLNYDTEYRFDTTGGNKNSRFADVVVYDSKGRVMEIHQVGRTTRKTGAPVLRERKAIRDIRSSKDYNGARIFYHPYDAK